VSPGLVDVISVETLRIAPGASRSAHRDAQRDQQQQGGAQAEGQAGEKPREDQGVDAATGEQTQLLELAVEHDDAGMRVGVIAQVLVDVVGGEQDERDRMTNVNAARYKSAIVRLNRRADRGLPLRGYSEDGRWTSARFVILASSLIRHSDFVICYSGGRVIRMAGMGGRRSFVAGWNSQPRKRGGESALKRDGSTSNAANRHKHELHPLWECRTRMR